MGAEKIQSLTVGPPRLVSTDEDLGRALRAYLGDLALEMTSSRDLGVGVHRSGRQSGLLMLDASQDRNISMFSGDAAAIVLSSALDIDETIMMLSQNPNVFAVVDRVRFASDDFLKQLVRRSLGVSMSSTVSAREVLLETSIRSYREHRVLLEEISQTASSLGCFKDFPGMVATTAWELLMNAFSAGMQGGETLDAAEGDVDVSVEKTSDALIVSVTDHHGTFSKERVLEGLARCARRGDDQVKRVTGSAGVGLYAILNNTTRILFDVNPGKRTEVTVTIRLAKSQREFESVSRSIAFLTER